VNFAEYQIRSLRTYKTDLSERSIFTNCALGLAGESGEVADLVKKYLYPSKPGDGNDTRERLIDELGDVLWYVAVLAIALNIDLEDIAVQNIAKLAARHPITEKAE
jgi:NTP pyrophosphatase (non-canonical NTP hydrolase)